MENTFSGKYEQRYELLYNAAVKMDHGYAHHNATHFGW